MANLDTGSTVEFDEVAVASTTVTDAPTPARIGRYVVEAPLGRGGMGIVFAAFDPQLDRRVALKLLRPDRPTGAGALHDDEWRRHLLAEARALAQLSDPNVVQVFDLGPHDRAVYVAMELVDGCTLSEWLKARPRTLAEILPVFLAAGRGLAAAHAVAIVHRDFKPGNVLIGTDGRVRVADFGLAAACSSGTAGVTPSSTESTGAVVMGTVGYMAPEQRRGQPTDHRADQYSFCVALHYAIFGEKPEQTEQGDALVCARSEPPVPSSVRSVIARGLQTDPAARFESMDALLAALVRNPSRARWMVAAGIAIVPFGVFGALASTPAAPTHGCRAASERLAGVWDADVRAAVESGFAATRDPYAVDASPRVVHALDAWAAAWEKEYAAACVAPAESVARIDCLHAELDRARAVGEVLREPDARVVVRALDSVHGLRAPSACATPHDTIGAPPADRAAAVEATRALVHTAEAHIDAGLFDEAHGIAKQAVVDADEIGWAPLQAETMLLLGLLQQQRLQPDEAKAALDQAFLLGRQSGHEGVAMRAAVRMIELYGIDLREDKEALRWAREAEASLIRYGGDTDAEIGMFINLGSVFDLVGRHEEARTQFEQALALVDTTELAPERGATIYNSLGIVALNMGDEKAGIAHIQRAIEMTEAGLGPEHPELALFLMNLATTHLERRELATARPLLERALAIRERAFGRDNPLTAHPLSLLGVTADLAGNHTEALAILQRVLAIRERALPKDHPDTANTHNSLAVVLAALGRREEAREHQIAALAMLERRVGDSHRDLAQMHLNLGEFAFQDEQWPLARDHFQRAIELQEAAIGSNHRSLAGPLYNLAEVELELGDPGAAVRLAERSIAVAGADDPPERARARKQLLARAKLRAH